MFCPALVQLSQWILAAVLFSGGVALVGQARVGRIAIVIWLAVVCVYHSLGMLYFGMMVSELTEDLIDRRAAI